MQCDKCNYAPMNKALVNYVPMAGYSTILEYSCPECDRSFKAVK